MGACTSQVVQLQNMMGGGSASDGKDPKSVPLTGEPWKRLKEKFEAPHGETYEVTIQPGASGEDEGLSIIVGAEGQCMKMLISYLRPFGPAHISGVAPGTRVLTVNGDTMSTEVYLKHREAFKSGTAMVLKLERPAFGHVIAKDGPNAGKPTISTWKSMGLKVEEIAGKYGKASIEDFTKEEYVYFQECLARTVHFACNYPGWGKDGAKVLFDAPFWEEASANDSDFQLNMKLQKKTYDGASVWCPVKCDDVGLPLNYEGETHLMTEQLSGVVPISCRFGFAKEQLVTAEMEYWERLVKLYKNMDSIRYKSASTCSVRNKDAAKYVQKKVYFVPDEDIEAVNEGRMKKYWECEICVADDDLKYQADLYIKQVDGAPQAAGEWQIVDSKNDADISVWQKPDSEWNGHYMVRFVEGDAYKGLTPLGCASGPMMFNYQDQDESCQ